MEQIQRCSDAGHPDIGCRHRPSNPAVSPGKWLSKNIKITKRTPTISDFRYTIYEPVAASHRHPHSGFPRQKKGTIKHAILRNEAKFREGLFFNQVAVRQAIVRDFWPHFRRAILKNEANLSIYDCRFANCDLRTASQRVARRMQSPRSKGGERKRQRMEDR
jgi:hypothetical protein